MSDSFYLSMVTLGTIFILRNLAPTFYIFFCILVYISTLAYLYKYKTFCEDLSYNEMNLISSKKIIKVDQFLVKLPFLEKIVLFIFKRLNLASKIFLYLVPLAFAVNDIIIDIVSLITLVELWCTYSIIRFAIVRSQTLNKLAKESNFYWDTPKFIQKVIIVTFVWFAAQ